MEEKERYTQFVETPSSHCSSCPQATGQTPSSCSTSSSCSSPSPSCSQPSSQSPMVEEGEEKTVYIETYGCQMNVYDSDKMVSLLETLGYAKRSEPDNADIILINTCSVRKKAEERVFSRLGKMRQVKEERAKKGKQTVIALMGCMAQSWGAKIFQRAPYVDFVLGSQQIQELTDLLAHMRERPQSLLQKQARVRLAFEPEEKFLSFQKNTLQNPSPSIFESLSVPSTLSEMPSPDSLSDAENLSGKEKTSPCSSAYAESDAQRKCTQASAFLTIQEGCNKFCHYCVVPFTRGREFSRPPEAISEEAKRLVQLHGVKEIVLLGQNVSGYSGKDRLGRAWSLADLLYHLAEIPLLRRLRYMTSHPCDVSPDLVLAHRDIPILMPFIHLPVQSGSDRILAMMNRHYSAAQYEDLILQFRQVRPDIAFSSDFIVGFPGETDADFALTCELIDRVQFAQAFSFAYSPRPNTVAEKRDRIAKEVASERLYVLQEKLLHYQLAFNTRMVGSCVPVLVEKPSRRKNQWVGKSPFMQLVNFSQNEDLVGAMVLVTLTSAGPNSLVGTVAESLP